MGDFIVVYYAPSVGVQGIIMTGTLINGIKRIKFIVNGLKEPRICYMTQVILLLMSFYIKVHFL